MPVFFFEGTRDQATPIELAEEYFANIVAPHKEFIRFEGCHHFVVMNRPIDFLKELLTKVRPWL
jgi:pimeloyl-ACP methyl ester carboxylesterase